MYQVTNRLPFVVLIIITLITIAMIISQQSFSWPLIIVNVLVAFVAAVLWLKS